MMSHEEIRELLPLAAANVLSAEEDAAVREHVGECHSCRAELDQFALIVGECARLPTELPPPWLAQKTVAVVRSRLEADRERHWEIVRGVVLGGVSWSASLAGCWCIHQITGFGWLPIAIACAAFSAVSALCAVWIVKSDLAFERS